MESWIMDVVLGFVASWLGGYGFWGLLAVTILVFVNSRSKDDRQRLIRFIPEMISAGRTGWRAVMDATEEVNKDGKLTTQERGKLEPILNGVVAAMTAPVIRLIVILWPLAYKIGSLIRNRKR